MKRFLCVLLSVTMVLSFATVKASASGGGNPLIPDVAERANELLNGNSDIASGVAEGIKRLANAPGGAASGITNQASLFSSFMTGAKNLSLGLSLINGTVSFLKLTGIMQDGTAAQLSTIYDCLLEVQETVKTIDKRTEDIQKNLAAQAATTTYNFRLERYDGYQQTWNDFFSAGGSYDEMQKLMDSYQSELNKRMVDYTENWQNGSEVGIRVLYSDNDMNLFSGTNLNGPGKDLSREPYFSDDGYPVYTSVILPGDYIRIARQFVDSDSYLDLLTQAVNEGTRKAISEEALLSSDETFYARYDAMEDEEKEKLIARLSRDFTDAVIYDAAYETANMNYNVGTFASAVKSTFTTFSNTMLGVNGVTSPLEAGTSKLALTHGFEGEVKKEAAAVCAYLTEIGMAYGEFTTFLTAMDRSLSAKNKAEVVDRCLKTAYYPVCYHDSFITGHDSYCYPLKAVIDYSEASYEATYYYTKSEPYNAKDGGWTLMAGNFGSTLEGVQDIFKNNRMLSKEDMATLYLYYESYRDDGHEGLDEFNDYLDAIGVLPEAYRNYQLCPFLPSMSPVYLLSQPEPYNLMKRKVEEYRTRDKVWGDTIQFYKDKNVKIPAGTMDYSKEGESTVDYHDQMRADVFDTELQGVSLEERMKNANPIAERAYTYYVLKKSHGAGEYVYVGFADPKSNIYFDYTGANTKNTITVKTRTFGILSYSKTQVRSAAATSFGTGNAWIIGGAIIIATAGAVTAICLSNKKKKKEEEDK